MARRLAAALAIVAAAMAPAHALDPSRDVTQYMHDVWDTESGLPQSSVFAICQTRNGYLWLGTQEGLARFDGSRFTLLSTANLPGLRNNYVSALVEDRDGALWIGTVGGGVSRLADGVVSTWGTMDGLGSDRVRALAVDGAGLVWAGTDGGLDRLEGERFLAVTRPDGSPLGLVRSLAVDGDDVLWAGTDGDGLFAVTRGVATAMTAEDGLPSDSILALHVARDGALWIGTQAGLCRRAGARTRTFTPADGLGGPVVTAILEDRQGNVWAGTYGGGLSRLTQGVWRTFGPDDGLSGGIVASMMEDREGSLWVGNNGGGLDRFRDTKVTTLTTGQGLSHDLVLAILEDAGGALWIGTAGGGVNRVKDGAVTTYSTREGLRNDLVFSLHQDRLGTMWIGTDGGIDLLSNGEATPWIAEDGGPSDVRVRSMFEDRDGVLWIGTDGAGVLRRDRGTVTRLGQADGLASPTVSSFLQDREGAIWIGTEGGVTRLSRGKLETFTTRHGLSSDFVLCLFQDSGGSIWVGTSGGLNLWEGGAFRALGARDGLFENPVSYVAEDAHGHLWLGTLRGIWRAVRLDRGPSGSPSFAATWFGRSDGMRSAECNGGFQPAGWEGTDGRIWFPTVKGAVVVDPDHMPTNKVPPPVMVERLQVDGEPVPPAPPGGVVHVPAGSKKFDLSYTAPSFLDADRVRFKVRLDGFDPEWVDAGTERTAHYTNLRPRRYTFHVIACNDDGVWNEEGARLTFVLHPRFYQTTWFLGLGALLLAGAATGLHRARLGQLRARERELSALVAERTHHLRLAVDELRLRNEELAGLDQEKSEFLGFVAHDLKNPLNIVRGYAEMMMDDPGMDVGERGAYLEKIAGASRRMVDLAMNLIDINAIERGQLACALAPCDVGVTAAQVVESYRRTAAGKGQSLEYAPPGPAVATADGSLLVQVCDNLVSNAIKYAPPGTRIRIRVLPRADAVRLEVQDEGPGISADDQKRLFHKFARLSARPTGGEHSSGLGLSIVRKMVEAMGGRVWCESQLGQGATFIVEFPGVDGAPRAGPPGRP